MARPMLNNVDVFDAKKDYTFKFNWYGNYQLKTISLYVSNMTTGDNVYTGTQDFDGKNNLYTLLASSSTLSNGLSYNAYIQITDIKGNTSKSNIICFQCLTTPVLSLDIKDGDIFTSNLISATISFSQNETDTLKNIKTIIFDNNKTEIYNSGFINCTSENFIYNADTNKYEYVSTFSGLNLDSSYSVQIIANTVAGFYITLGVDKTISFSISCEVGSYSGNLTMENIPFRGCNTIKSHMSIINDEGKDFTFVITDDYTLVNLMEQDLTYNTGILFSDDIVFGVKGFYQNTEHEILHMENYNKDSIILSSILDDDDKIRYKLVASSYGLNYVIYSDDAYDLTEKDLVTIMIYRKNNIYDMRIRVVTSALDISAIDSYILD